MIHVARLNMRAQVTARDVSVDATSFYAATEVVTGAVCVRPGVFSISTHISPPPLIPASTNVHARFRAKFVPTSPKGRKADQSLPFSTSVWYNGAVRNYAFLGLTEAAHMLRIYAQMLGKEFYVNTKLLSCALASSSSG